MNRQTVTIGAGLLAAVLVVFGILAYIERDRPAESPPPVTGPGRAEEARGIIAGIEERRASAAGGAAAPESAAPARPGADTELDAAFEQAKELQAAGKLDDAQLLYFFGAREGHAQSAFAYAEMNDPNHHSAETSLLPEPDGFQAFRWYSVALDGGVEAAAGRLDALHAWARDAAAAGDTAAEQLLLQWEQ